MISGGLIKAIQDIMRQDDGVDGDAQRLSQLVWMIFLKILDDNEQEMELLNKSYVPAIPSELQWRSWAANQEGLTGSSLLDFVNNLLFTELRSLPINMSNQRTQIVKEVFEDSHNYMKNGTLLRQVVNRINTIDFNKQGDRHSFNDIYETLLKSLQSAGNSGEYYTPRPVTQFIVEMVDPKFGESILDPACGTGGFLSNAIEHIRKQVKTPEDERLLQDSVRGVEKKQLPHLLCTTNMILHGIEVPINIRRDNTLKRPLKDYGPADRVDVIVTNPPFGGTEEPGIESNFPQNFRTRETADLFLVLIMKLLKSGGRAGIVLPDSTLFGEGVKVRIKEELLQECNLHTIVRLPGSVFAPYTPIATNLLFFTKGEPTKEIWYYEHNLPHGVKSYNKGNPIKLEEFEPIKGWWSNRVENEYAWKISIDDIKKHGYDLDFKNPNKLRDPEATLEKLLASHQRKKELLGRLSNELQPVLGEIYERTKSEDISFIKTNLSEIIELKDFPSLIEGVVLENAGRGSLVHQDTSDGDAEELYKHIKSTITTLTSEGKVKKQKALPDVRKDGLPFDLPNNWKWTRLGDLGTTVTGKTPPTKLHSLVGGSIPFVGPGDIRGWKINDAKKKIDQAASKQSETAVFGDLMMVCIGGSIGKVAFVEETITFNQQINKISPIGIESKYLFYVLRSPYFQQVVISGAVGGATPIINQTRWAKILVPLPPKAEQKRIIDKIEEIFSITKQFREALIE